MSASQRPAGLRRLAIAVTILAAVAACIVGLIVLELSREAAYDEQVAQTAAAFSLACFGLAWLSSFLVGWLLMRRRAPRNEN